MPKMDPTELKQFVDLLFQGLIAVEGSNHPIVQKVTKVVQDSVDVNIVALAEYINKKLP